MKQDKVREIVNEIAPAFHLETNFVMAIIEQESSFREDSLRFELGFMRKYLSKFDLLLTQKILLSTSYGLMQVMGQSLNEMGYFGTITKENNNDLVKELEHFMSTPKVQIKCGCEWYVRKLRIANGDTHTALQYWNGGGNKNYADEVLLKYETINKSSFL